MVDVKQSTQVSVWLPNVVTAQSGTRNQANWESAATHRSLREFARLSAARHNSTPERLLAWDLVSVQQGFVQYIHEQRGSCFARGQIRIFEPWNLLLRDSSFHHKPSKIGKNTGGVLAGKLREVRSTTRTISQGWTETTHMTENEQSADATGKDPITAQRCIWRAWGSQKLNLDRIMIGRLFLGDN